MPTETVFHLLKQEIGEGCEVGSKANEVKNGTENDKVDWVSEPRGAKKRSWAKRQYRYSNLRIVTETNSLGANLRIARGAANYWKLFRTTWRQTRLVPA
jgi:hypothetical protein